MKCKKDMAFSMIFSSVGIDAPVVCVCRSSGSTVLLSLDFAAQNTVVSAIGPVIAELIADDSGLDCYK